MPSTRDDVAVELGASRIESGAAPTPGDVVDVLELGSRCRRRRHGSDAHRRAAGDADGHDLSAKPVYLRPWPHTRAVTGDPCDAACVAVEEEYAYNDRVDLRGFEWQPRRCPVDGRCLDVVAARRT